MELTAVYRLNATRYVAVVSATGAETRTEQDLFPRTADAMNAFDVIVLGREAEAFFDNNTEALLTDFVAKRGGSLIFARGKPYGGRFQSLAKFEPLAWGDGVVSGVKLRPTEAGRDNPIFDLGTAGTLEELLERLPALDQASVTLGEKPLAVVLANTVQEDGPVLIAYQRYGQGRTISLNASGLWHWAFRESGQDESEIAYQRFWVSLLQWLLGGSEFLPGSDVALTSAHRYYNSEQPMQFLISTRNLDRAIYQPRLLISGNGKTTEVEPRARGESFVAEAGPFAPGTYVVTLKNNVGNPAELSQSIEVVSASVEKRELSADPDTMRQARRNFRRRGHRREGRGADAGNRKALGSGARAFVSAAIGLGPLVADDGNFCAAGRRVVAAAAGGIAVNFQVLHHVCARFAGWLALRILLAALALPGHGVVAVLSDAALDLPEAMRAAVPWLLGMAMAVALGAGFLEWRRLTESRLARRFEQSDAALGNRLINAVQLAQRTSASAAEEFFRREAVDLGRQSAKDTGCLAGHSRTASNARALFSAAFCWRGCFCCWRKVIWFTAVLPRFLDAHGDHPPYSRLKIAVTADRAEVIYGGQVEVRATTSGRPVEKLWLVTRSGTNETRAIMFLAPDKSFFQTLVNLREPTEYFVTDGAARSRRFSVAIRYTPQITMVEVATTFPEYTGKPPHTGKLADEPQALPEGTRVAFRVASNRPLKSGSLELTPVLGGKPVHVPLLPEAQNTVVTGAFVLMEAVVFDLSVRDVGNLDSAEAKRGRFNILPDRPPRLFVLEPGRDAVATPNIRVPVRVQAVDDYAVSRVVWLRSHNRSIERPFNMKLTLKSGPQSVEAAGAFELDKLGVRPGDVIEYYFEAADNYPKGPNITFSRPFRLEIISQEQYEAILRQAAARKALFEPYFKLDAWLRRLAERSRNLESEAERGDSSARADAEELAKQLAQYDEALGKLMQDPAMFDVENSFRATLAGQQAQLRDAAAKLKRGAGRRHAGRKTVESIERRIEPARADAGRTN